MKTDSQLQQDVLEELRFEPSINASHIWVTADDGVVGLTGTMESYAGKRNSPPCMRLNE